MQRFGISDQGRPGDRWLAETVRWAWRTKIQVHLNIDLRLRLWNAAEAGSRARVRGQPARSAAGRAGRARVTMGLDPGYRTGVKVAVVDATGKVRRDHGGSIRTNRSANGTRRWRFSASWPDAQASS